jgi:hypothetical protein
LFECSRLIIADLNRIQQGELDERCSAVAGEELECQNNNSHRKNFEFFRFGHQGERDKTNDKSHGMGNTI